jgi:TPR repeat protein
MEKLPPILVGCLLLCAGSYAQPASSNALARTQEQQMATEQAHFLRCLAYVYDPVLWISYTGALYFVPKTDAQAQQLEAMRAARARYVALTNRQTRYEITARAVAESGIGEQWRSKLLLPYSDTNQNLTPTLGKSLRTIPQYEVLQALPSGDALITDGAATVFVLDFGHGASDAYHTNAALIKEGVKSYRMPAGEWKTVEAFTDAGLNEEETTVLRRVVAAFQRQADSTPPPDSHRETAGSTAALEFEMHRIRATDASPYIEYLLAKDYLEGLGTEKNEELGIVWMNRAAKDGSGDASAYLEKLKAKVR